MTDIKTLAEYDREWTKRALRVLRGALKKRDGSARILNGLRSLMGEAHIQGRIQGRPPSKGTDHYQKLWLDSLVAFVRGLQS